MIIYLSNTEPLTPCQQDGVWGHDARLDEPSHSVEREADTCQEATSRDKKEGKGGSGGLRKRPGEDTAVDTRRTGGTGPTEVGTFKAQEENTHLGPRGVSKPSEPLAPLITTKTLGKMKATPEDSESKHKQIDPRERQKPADMTSTKVRSYFLFRFFFFFPFLFSLIALTYEQALNGALVAASKYTSEKGQD